LDADVRLGRARWRNGEPAIQFYYWGDDISPTCVEKGCWSSIHDTQKDRYHWQMLGDQLAAHLNSKLGGAKAVVFLESEFNKKGISTYEPFDGYLATIAYRLHGAYPNAVIVLAFGNWQSGDWHNFDRAAAASSMIGLQGLRGSTKDSATAYNDLYSATLAGSKTMASLFHKPIMLTDIGLSSYTEPNYLTMQHDNLKKFFSGIGSLQGAGVKTILYRSWYDSPGASTANFYGEAERHWGLAYSGSSRKAAAQAWIDGVKAVRYGSSSSSSSTTSSTSGSTSGGYTAQFAPASGANEWWVDVKVTASPTPVKVEAQVAGGSWTALATTDYGTWAKSMSAPKGSSVVFRATDSTGRVAWSPTMTWLGPATFPATFTAKSLGNDYWVEAAVSSSSVISKVEARLNGGPWTALPKTSWGTYASDLHAPDGTQVVFRATSSTGAIATSSSYAWT
jgi:hypothetical protein